MMKKPIGYLLAALLFCGCGASAAFFGVTEEFTGSVSGWTDRDSGELTVSHSASGGNPGGYLSGNFSAQGFPLPEIDAFRATSSASSGTFTGDYLTDVPTATGWRFEFLPEDVAASTVQIRFGDGANTFFQIINSQVSTVGSWNDVLVPLSYSGWNGGSESAFNTALGGVTFIEIQVTRNGTGAQDYGIDNFRFTDEVIAAVPEPSSLGMMAMILGFVYWKRRVMLLRAVRAHRE